MVSNSPVLICTDLDRTLLPNGMQQESAEARPLFRQLVQQPEVKLAYVSGRDKGLLYEAIREYDIPLPDYAITDVGSTIYHINDNDWQVLSQWHAEIGRDWGKHSHQFLTDCLDHIGQLQLQEPAKQAKYKLSYYADPELDTAGLLGEIQTILQQHGIRANLIWSIDETTHTGLLDILPQSANKLHAIRFLIQQQGYQPERVVFAGDSGNDLEVLCSDIQAVLVNNATDAVRTQALAQARQNQCSDRLYLARGNFLGMNGYYAAGILEGVVHYLPETLDWLKPKN